MKIERISHLNLLMTIFILVLHTRAGTNVFLDCPLWFVHVDRVIVDLTSAAVPTFFSISAFLLFRNYKLFDYKRKVVNRIRSLVLPYAIFSTLGCLIILSLKYIKNGFVDANIFSIVCDIYRCTYDSPIWYVRALFYYVLVSPIVLLVFNKMRVYGMCLLLVMSIVINLTVKVPYDTFFYWMPDIILFSYLGLNGTRLLEVRNKNLLCLGLLFILLYLVHDLNQKSSVYWCYRMILPLLFLPMNLFRWKFSGTFFVYMIHGIVNSVAFFVYRDFVHFNYWMPLVRPLSIVFTCLIVYFALKKISPVLFRTLNGGRN